MATRTRPTTPPTRSRRESRNSRTGAERDSRIRRLVKQAAQGVVEEVKWRKPSDGMRGVPVWSKDGMICSFETYEDKVKLIFAKGAALDDPAGLFNAGFGGHTRRAIDLREGDDIDEAVFMSLMRRAVAQNEPAKKG
ncbi:MAG: DUF1801 domain-containing protein [Trueperaceae bacterium]|nr:DUF1801 domain-containing protein [Trueperaceae bacterium]